LRGQSAFRGFFTAKSLEYLSSFFCFWRPSVARRITLYFLIFGMLIFLVSTVLYVTAARRAFLMSTGKLIQDQFNKQVNVSEADFFLNKVNHSEPGLYRIFQILSNLSSGFYSVSDVAVYSRISASAAWFRLYFGGTDVLRSELSQDPVLKRLDRLLKRSFQRMSTKLLSEAGATAMYVNLTGGNDINQYFLRIELDREDMAAFIRRQLKLFLFFFLIVIIVSRLLAHVFVRKIAKPIENLSKAVTKVANGDLSKMVPVITQDEIGQLAKNFNTMIEKLREWERVRKIEFELEKGRAIQKEFLPRNIPQLPNYHVAARFQPAGQVSGDFYDVFLLPDGCLGLVIADVCDKGVGSALYMALFRSLIRVYAIQLPPVDRTDLDHTDSDECASSGENIQYFNPALHLQAVSSTNNYIAEIHGDEGMFATIFFGVLNPSTGHLCYVNGGHEPLFIIGKRGLKRDLGPSGPAVGMIPNMKFNIGQIFLEPGDTLFGYTDGVTEARSPGDELFTRERLKSLLAKASGSPEELLDGIQSDLSGFIGSMPRHDDITMLAIERVSE
jgi:serine phosphatase RsbU (regulator of sigma subunit)